MKGYKTLLFNGSIFVTVLLIRLFGDVDPAMQPMVDTIIAAAAANIGLRFATTGPAMNRKQGGYIMGDMFRWLVVLSILGAGIAGCSTLEKVGQTLKDNQAVADIVVTQAVIRYTDRGDEFDIERRTRVCEVATGAESFLIGKPMAGVSEILAIVDKQIHWDNLSRADRLLVQDLMLVVQEELKRRQGDGELSEDAQLSIQHMLNTVKRVSCVQ